MDTKSEDAVQLGATDVLRDQIDEALRSRFIDQVDCAAPVAAFEAPAQNAAGTTRCSFISLTTTLLPSLQDAMDALVRAVIPMIEPYAGEKGRPGFMIWRIRPTVLQRGESYLARVRFYCTKSSLEKNAALAAKAPEDAA